jgi:hypothetical protein
METKNLIIPYCEVCQKPLKLSKIILVNKDNKKIPTFNYVFTCDCLKNIKEEKLETMLDSILIIKDF